MSYKGHTMNNQQSGKLLRDMLIGGSKTAGGYSSWTKESKQAYMDKYLGGVSFADVLELVKQHYPEKFI